MRWLVALVALLATAPVHAEGVAADAEIALGRAYEPFEEFGYDSSGLVLGIGVGAVVTPRLTLQGRLRAGMYSEYSYSRWFPLALGPWVTVGLGPVWLSGGVSIAYVANNGSHCFRHPDGLGGETALALGVPISSRVALALTSAVTVIDSGDERHTDLELLAGVRIALGANP